jgi:delta 1-pyrroline-5-carboxylate dehydrogenase
MNQLDSPVRIPAYKETQMPGYTMTIDGKSVKGSKSTGVINPATGKIFAEVPDCSKAELDQAMAAAQKAFPSWSKDLNARRKVLQDCAAALHLDVVRIHRHARPARRSADGHARQ